MVAFAALFFLFIQIARNDFARIVDERNLLAVGPEGAAQLPARVETATAEARLKAFGSLNGSDSLDFVQTLDIGSGCPRPSNNFQPVHRIALL
jgi:hypothetical protein